ncbi:hypothetical protein Salat_0680800 [Sesamum alatum]|uniref:DUF4216 domain-containing protein n=1 Tax=Sesamum alatum TaxID=300844 RepID=A0AAE1YRQ5_9LAMI|nr:hypothetical protein Salat_0680800 [Sesamum alatum]
MKAFDGKKDHRSAPVLLSGEEIMEQLSSIEQVEELHSDGVASDESISLANGPDTRVKHYTGCNVNRFRFHIKDSENNKMTQNSGVVVEGEHNKKIIDFYGVVKDILEIYYLQGAKRVLIFRCDWWNLNDRSGIQMDRNSSITRVNVCKTWYEDQPFVLAYQMGGPGRRVVGQSGSSSLHKDSSVHLHSREEIMNNVNIRIKRRGRTRNVALSKRINANEKLTVRIPEEVNRIVGVNSQFAITESGCLTRRFAPLQVTKWAKIEEVKLQKRIMKKIMELLIDRQATGQSSVDEEQIYAEVLGYKSRYIRGRGAGSKPNRSWSKQSYWEELENAKRNARIAQERVIMLSNKS